MEKLGIEPARLIMQVINFTVLVVLLAKFLYRPILKLIEERKEKIKEGLELAEKMKEEKEKLVKLREKEVDKGKEEAIKIIQEAKKEAKILAEKMIADAQIAAQVEVEKRRKEIEGERLKLEGDLRREAVEMAAVMAEKVVEDLLHDENNQRKLIEKQIHAIAKLKHETK